MVIKKVKLNLVRLSIMVIFTTQFSLDFKEHFYHFQKQVLTLLFGY